MESRRHLKGLRAESSEGEASVQLKTVRDITSDFEKRVKLQKNKHIPTFNPLQFSYIYQNLSHWPKKGKAKTWSEYEAAEGRTSPKANTQTPLKRPTCSKKDEQESVDSPDTTLDRVPTESAVQNGRSHASTRSTCSTRSSSSKESPRQEGNRTATMATQVEPPLAKRYILYEISPRTHKIRSVVEADDLAEITTVPTPTTTKIQDDSHEKYDSDPCKTSIISPTQKRRRQRRREIKKQSDYNALTMAYKKSTQTTIEDVAVLRKTSTPKSPEMKSLTHESHGKSVPTNKKPDCRELCRAPASSGTVMRPVRSTNTQSGAGTDSKIKCPYCKTCDSPNYRRTRNGVKAKLGVLGILSCLPTCFFPFLRSSGAEQIQAFCKACGKMIGRQNARGVFERVPRQDTGRQAQRRSHARTPPPIPPHRITRPQEPPTPPPRTTSHHKHK